MPGSARWSVLVVEDQAQLRRLIALILEGEGYIVAMAADGVEALSHAASCDLLVTDMTMPRMGGGELAASIRAVRPDLPVVIVTGHAAELRAEDLPPGVAVLSKPFAPDALISVVRDALM